MPTLHWIGKEKVVSHHQDVPYRILDHKYGFTEKGKQETETNSGNKIIKGDNLEALKALTPEYEGQIDVIYIDPPYNTGNEKWVYNDNVNHPKIKKWLGEVVGKDGEDLTRHDKWLCMMYPRLKLLHKLLSDDGVIFISIDDNEQANLALLCDQIFGKTNSIGPIIQNKMNSKNDTVNIQKNHEFVLVYRKSKRLKKNTTVSSTILNKVYKTKSVYKEGAKFYFFNDYITTRGEGGILNARHNLGHTVYYNPKTNDKIAICDYNLELAKTSNDLAKIYKTDSSLISQGYEIIRPPNVRGKLGCWTWSLDKINSQKEDLVVTGKRGSYGLKKRTFVEPSEVFNEDGKYLIKIFEEGNSRSIIDFSTNEGTKVLNEIMESHGVFENPKNISMLEYLIKLFPNKNSLVLDSFAGSGSTGEAVLKLNKKDGGNRKFILVELEEYANTITAKRIKKVIQGYKFKGKQKEALSEYPINVTNLKKADKILKELQEFKDDSQYSKVSLTENNGAISIVGEKTVSGKTDGIGGSFDFYELGKPIFKDNENLNEEVGEDKIRNYIYYTETKQPLIRPQSKEAKYLLDNYQDTGYYFYYEKDSLTTLDNNSLGIITELQEQYIIYADVCLLDEAYMLNKNIIFKKIPRDIKRF
jgi:adenine-specific DNA-methyltransferase